MAYGIANRSGIPSRAEALSILSLAWSAGIRTVDTAPGYGSSEETLGELGLEGWRVITKLPRVPPGLRDVRQWVRQTVLESRARLRVSRLYGLLLHDRAIWSTPEADAVVAEISALREEGVVAKVGPSVYAPAEIECAAERFQFDIIQAPYNVLDRRFASSGWLSRLHAQGVEIHTRSAFLQGLLTMPPTLRPAFTSRWERTWRDWDAWLERSGLDPAAACLGVVLAQPEIDHIVVGVDSVHHLRGVVEGLSQTIPLPPEALAMDDPDLLLPFNWPRAR